MKKVAFVGTGNIFEAVHYPEFSRYKTEYEVAAIVDTSSERCEAVATKYNIANWFTSTKEMLEKCKPFITVVCVPNKFHYESVMLALESGSHVLCEKPPAINAIQAKEMMELAQKNNLVLSYNLHYRHSPNVDILKKQIDLGNFGIIYNVSVQALRRRGVPGWGNFINKDLQGGGPLIDIGIHMLDTAMYLIGFPKVKSISASSYQEIGKTKSKGTLGNWNPEKYEVEDSVFAFLQFHNGASLTLETSFALNVKEKSVMNVLLRGTEAGASVFPLEIYSDTDGELTDKTFPFMKEGTNYETSIGRFLDNCEGKHSMIANGQEGFYLQKLIDDIYLSAKSGDVIKYD